MLPSLFQRSLLNFVKTQGSQGLMACSARWNTSYTSGGLWEPDYLEAMKSKIPLLNTMNIQLKGYDFPILESYQKFVHGLATNMDIEVDECWATPPQKLKVSTFKPNSAVVESDYTLHLYERNIQISDVKSTVYPVLLSAIMASVPEGVTVNVHEHTDDDELVRYIPDLELKELKDQLTIMGGPTDKRKRRK